MAIKVPPKWPISGLIQRQHLTCLGKGYSTQLTADKLHHWNFIPYLMGFGGQVFKDPPGNLTPTWDTPEAATAADFYGNLLSKYGPSGILSFTDGQSMETQKTGRAKRRSGPDWRTKRARSFHE